MHVSIIQAGTLLARFGRPEVRSCISALEQYRQSYEETSAQVEEMKRTFNSATSGEQTLGFMHMFPRNTGGRQHSWSAVQEAYQHGGNGIGNGNGMLVDMKAAAHHQGHHHVPMPAQFEQRQFFAAGS